MTILLTGGGTGGHITPILAVAHELKRQNPDVKIVYIGERDSKFSELTRDHEAIDEVYTIWTGKLRRYYGESLVSRLLDVKTIALNIRDLVYVVMGFVQCLFLLGKIRPNAVLLKGGFVGVPVGLAAALRRLPFVTHDSDAIPGLANRLVSRWAAVNAVALPAHEYMYPASKTRQVGVLVEPNFHEVGTKEQGEYKRQIGVPVDQPMLLVTGSSSGAQRLNDAMVRIVDKLLNDYPSLHIVHQVGKGNMGCYGDYGHPRLQVLEFMRPMYTFTGAADVVVARASANTIAELGSQRKAAIVVPSPFLAGGHQLKNAKRLLRNGAVLSVPETAEGTDEQKLAAAIRELLDDTKKRARLADVLHKLTIKDATTQLSQILLDLGEDKK